MTRRHVVGAAGVMLAGAVALAQTPPVPPPAPTQTFRATTDAVSVDVSVREGDRMVAGLAAGAFVLTDNGVRQTIGAVEASAVPIDLTLIVDVSGNPFRPWTTPSPDDAAKLGASLDAEVQQVTSILRPDDRVQLLAIDTYSRQLFASSAPGLVRPVGRVDGDGLAAVYDTLAAALLQPVEPNRRHVIVARTKGRDTISVLDARTVQAMAARSDALLHVVMMERAVDREDAVHMFQCAWMGICEPTARFWGPERRDIMGSPLRHTLTASGQAIAAGAAATGGALHQTELLSEPTLLGEFKRAFDDFRASYVLRYTPERVSREGWHDIVVTVPSHPSATVRWRKGYAIDSPPPAAPAPAPLPEGARLKTAPEFIDAFGRGEYGAVTRSMQATGDAAALIRDFRQGGNPWPATPHREAALALEFAEAGVFSTRDATRQDAMALLAKFTRFVRPPLEPDAFERAWTWAEVTILEGTIRPNLAGPVVQKATVRFPDDPRFVLARAIVTDQRLPIAGLGDPTQAHIDAVTSAYAAALARPETADEAHIRFGWFLHRIGRDAEALAALDAAADGPARTLEPALRYLRQLFRGQVLVSLHRLDDALDALREARTLAPHAQSAKVALMNTSLAAGDHATAEALAEDIQTSPTDVTDPWWSYWQGDYRHYAQAIAAVRELVR